MGLIRYSCGHISGHHEPIHVKPGVWGFFIMFYWNIIMKMLKCKKDNLMTSHFSTLFIYPWTVCTVKCHHSLCFHIAHLWSYATLWPWSHELGQAIYCNNFLFITIIFWCVTTNFWKFIRFKNNNENFCCQCHNHFFKTLLQKTWLKTCVTAKLSW